MANLVVLLLILICIIIAPAAAETEEEDAVVTAVKALIDAATCDDVTYAEYSATSGLCGDTATSYYTEFIYNNKRVVIWNNIPDHPAEHDELVSGRAVRCTGWQYAQLDVDPGKARRPSDTGLGTVGIAVTGGAFFNHLSNPDGSLALPNEGPTLDSCLGHCAPANGGGGAFGRKKRQTRFIAGRYHYHGNLNCSDAGSATGGNDPSQCKHVGYYLDGVPVYGLCQDSTGTMMTSCYKLNDGVTTVSVTTAFGTYSGLGSNEDDYTFSRDSSCNLDQGNGAIHPDTGEYSYFMTTDYPWIPIKYFGDGTTASICGISAV